MNFMNLGTQEYLEVLKFQRELQQKRIKQEIEDTVLFVEHPSPVITFGKSSNKKNILLDEETLLREGVAVHEIERGGDVTYHGPGQLLCYPIVDLNFLKRDVHWYMRQLEEVVIQILDSFGLKGERIEGKTGVWIRTKIWDKKIAALGVKLSKWVSLHGFSLNVKNDFDGFRFINPCGFRSDSVVWMSDLIESQDAMASLSIKEVAAIAEDTFKRIFEKKL